MERRVSILALGIIILFAARQGHADSCVFSTATQGTVSGSAANGSNAIEIENFSFDIGEANASGSQSSGAGAGKVTFSPFQITKKIDSASPQLFRLAINGEAIKSVRCSLYRERNAQGATLGPYLTAVLANATITKFNVDGTGNDVPRVKFWISYERIDWEF
jgi:type VI secretion system secreted protein Hcp